MTKTQAQKITEIRASYHKANEEAIEIEREESKIAYDNYCKITDAIRAKYAAANDKTAEDYYNAKKAIDAEYEN